MSFIGVVCGLKSEARAVRAALGANAGAEDRVVIGVSGANSARAEGIAQGFSASGATAILSIGVSGGLDPKLRSGDLIIGGRIITSDGEAWDSDPSLLAAIGDASAARGAATGPLFGADEIIATAAAKADLFENFNCLAVDMESHGAARAAGAAGTPFLAIRAIADTADGVLPKAALNAVAEDGSTRTLATLGAALRAPSQIPELMKLGQASGAALKTLRRDLSALLPRLMV